MRTIHAEETQKRTLHFLIFFMFLFCFSSFFLSFSSVFLFVSLNNLFLSSQGAPQPESKRGDSERKAL